MSVIEYRDYDGIESKYCECDACGKRGAWVSWCYGPEDWGVVLNVSKDDQIVSVIVNDSDNTLKQCDEDLVQFAWLAPQIGHTYCPKCLEELGIK